MTGPFGRLPVGTLAYGAGLAAAWVLLWGSLSWANVLSGVAVAAVLIWLLVPTERRHGRLGTIRPLALARLGIHLLRQLAVSNVVLIREVVAPRGRLRTGVVAVPVFGCSDQVVTTLANFMAMAPGTMPVEFRTDPRMMYVHVLHLRGIEEAREELLRLRDVTVRALGSAEAIAQLEVRTP